MGEGDNFNEMQERIGNILNNVAKKDLRDIDRLQGKSKRNNKPEKEVEAQCLAWMRKLSWDVNIYEAKAVYNPDGTYRSSRMKAGVCDCMGITPDGIPIYVEFKAKDRRSSFNADKNYRQKEFLLKKIDYLAFAVVVDSVDRLAEYWNAYINIVSSSSKINARDYLRSILPKKKSHSSSL